ncbi:MULTISPECIES: GntR family transcriptional regulator [unclassified Leucobacter]|uniref:GntR family transcriptional regulator n=1 Tax=unclassified Leucobacter TaxID=2621730 RepID=UPI0006993A8A|nr:GntR family transcriptional regulator [Leucobacter sp. Ag1]
MPRPASPPAPVKTRLNLSVDLLGDQVYSLLMNDIVLERYAPGERLNLDAIALQLGVSRTPVREAMRRLADWDDSDMQERIRALGLLVGSIIDRAPKGRLASAARLAGLGPADRARLDHGATDPLGFRPEQEGEQEREQGQERESALGIVESSEASAQAAHTHDPAADCAHRDPFAGLARFLDVCAELFPVAYPRGSGSFARGLVVPLGAYLTRPALDRRGFGSAIRGAGLDWCAAERELLRGRSAAFLGYTERLHRALD